MCARMRKQGEEGGMRGNNYELKDVTKNEVEEF